MLHAVLGRLVQLVTIVAVLTAAWWLLTNPITAANASAISSF